MNTASPVEPASNPKVEHNTRAFLSGLNSAGGPPLEQLSPKEARDLLVGLQASAPHDLPPAEVEQKTIQQDGLSLNLTIVRPIGVQQKGPAFLFFHGGGFMLGDFPSHERLVRDLVSDSKFTSIFVDYSRSPEAQYPTAINEAHAATKWVAVHGDEINVDGERLAVVGNSAGGSIATVVALKCKIEGGPALRGQILFCPGTDADVETSSYNEYADGYYLTKNMVKWFWDNHVPNVAQRREIYASPLQASIEQLKGLPPAHIQIAGNDVLRDEGVAYARKLDAAGGGHARVLRRHDPRLRMRELSQPDSGRSYRPASGRRGTKKTPQIKFRLTSGDRTGFENAGTEAFFSNPRTHSREVPRRFACRSFQTR